MAGGRMRWDPAWYLPGGERRYLAAADRQDHFTLRRKAQSEVPVVRNVDSRFRGNDAECADD